MKEQRSPSVLITGYEGYLSSCHAHNGQLRKGGIGHALALEFQSRGYAVFATLLAHEARDHLSSAGIYALTADVTSDDDVETLRDDLSAVTEGRLDVLVNNAGICYTMTAIDTDVSEAEKMFAVNVLGPMRMVRVFHPMLIRAMGTIVNVGSVGGVVPYVYGSSYNATKAALHHWGNTLRVEMKPLGVKVVNIISGEVATNILKRDQGRRLPEGSFYRPLESEFANHVARTPNCTSPEAYARTVVTEVCKRQPSAWLWTGAKSSVVWFSDVFLPRTFWDWIFSRDFQLAKLLAR